jgi:hypothetical protein
MPNNDKGYIDLGSLQSDYRGLDASVRGLINVIEATSDNLSNESYGRRRHRSRRRHHAENDGDSVQNLLGLIDEVDAEEDTSSYRHHRHRHRHRRSRRLDDSGEDISDDNVSLEASSLGGSINDLVDGSTTGSRHRRRRHHRSHRGDQERGDVNSVDLTEMSVLNPSILADEESSLTIDDESRPSNQRRHRRHRSRNREQNASVGDADDDRAYRSRHGHRSSRRNRRHQENDGALDTGRRAATPLNLAEFNDFRNFDSGRGDKDYDFEVL